MKHKFLTALPALAAIGFAGSASTVPVSLVGANVSLSGALTFGPDKYADPTGTTFGTPAILQSLSGSPPNYQGQYDPANALAVAGITGFFTDSTLGDLQ